MSVAAFDHEILLFSYQLLMEAATGETPPSLDLVFLVKTKTPQVIRVSSLPSATVKGTFVMFFLIEGR